MRRRLSEDEKKLASDIATMWEQSKFPWARVTIKVDDETDDNGRPVYGVVAESTGRLPRLGPDSQDRPNSPDLAAEPDRV